MRPIDRRVLIVSIIAALVFISTVIFAVMHHSSTQSNLTITNIETCSKNIDPKILDDVSNTVYDFVSKANDYNKKETDRHYDANIRDGSCSTKTNVVKSNVEGSRTVKSSEAIIDVPAAQQSWKFSYDWVEKGTPVDTVINGATPTCLPKELLVYGDFGCDKILGLDAYGTDKVDPILQYMPYDGAGFRLEYNPDTKTVSVIILPPAETKDVAAFTENTKAVIPYWFQKRGLDQSKYRVLYSSDVVDD